MVLRNTPEAIYGLPHIYSNERHLKRCNGMLHEPKWPDGHAAKVEKLLHTLETRAALQISKLRWASVSLFALNVRRVRHNWNIRQQDPPYEPSHSFAYMIPTLYFSPGACSLAPHIVLEEIGMPFHLSYASTSDGSTRTPEYLQLNPKGRVPVLVAGSSVFTEAPAILFHLATSNQDRGLLDGTSEGLVRSIEWFNWLSGTVHAVAIRQVWRPESFTDVLAQHEDVVAKGKKNLADAFAQIESRLSKTYWAVGESYSIVDPYLLVFYRWGNRIGFDMRSQYQSWTKHSLQILERPATIRALTREDVSVWR
jgi:glutathione S-transferase